MIHDTIVIIAFLLCHSTQQEDTKVLNVLCVHSTKSSKFSVSYDASLDVFLFRSTTCTKFRCKNVVTDFSQQMIIFNLLSFVLS